MSVQSVNTVIVGGGAIGLSIAYHLGLAGAQDVLLLERHELTSGTSWHAAGIIGPLRASLAATRLAAYAPECFRSLEQQTGQSTGYVQTGGLWLSQTHARDIELQRIAAIGRSVGFGVQPLTAAEIAEQQPWIDTQGLRSGIWVAEDGQANPVDICMAFAKAARALGVEIEQGRGITKIEPHQNSYLVHTPQGQSIYCEQLVVCAGLWSGVLLEPLGIRLPLQAVEHMYVVTETMPSLPTPLPITRDLDSGIYCKGDAGKMVLGGFEANAKVLDPKAPSLQQAYALYDEDWTQFEPFLEAGLKRFPDLQQAGIRQFLNGPESFTSDTQPLLGPVPGKPGLYVAAGMNSLGIVSAPGVGKSMAEWILEGTPEWDLLGQDVSRVDLRQTTKVFLHERMRESVANQFDMHWPYKQAVYARGAKRTPVHHLMQQQGAVFGQFAGWERPLWFAQSADEKQLDYGFEAQTWWPIVARESQALQQHCALMDLSPFCKIRISGAQATECLQWLCSREMDMALGRANYCLVLNPKAGIIADVTVTRLSAHDYLMVAAAACETKLWDWVQQQSATYRVSLQNTTATEAVFALAGPNSRALLQRLTDADLSAEGFTFGEVKSIDVGLVQCRAARLSFVGELGYELYCPIEFAAQLYESLCQAGGEFQLTPIGLLTIDACRLEKGFVHWGHDVGPADNPLAASMMFAVSAKKATNFCGKSALASLKKSGNRQRRVVLSVSPADDGSPPLLLHDEPIYFQGQWVGSSTSGVVGGRTQQALCMATIHIGDNADDLAQRHYQIDIAGTRHNAHVVAPCAYDPTHTRMRG